MDAHFIEMLRRLKLTKRQREDAKTKYTSVAKLLHNAFYNTEYNGSTKLLIGSYGKKTNIRPPGDVDLL
jgi:tRNA nucleotidyltransferase (CCA-adding enzyme)